MTRRLALATMSMGEPMGQQVYERELDRLAQGVLGEAWTVDRVVVKTM